MKIIIRKLTCHSPVFSSTGLIRISPVVPITYIRAKENPGSLIIFSCHVSLVPLQRRTVPQPLSFVTLAVLTITRWLFYRLLLSLALSDVSSWLCSCAFVQDCHSSDAVCIPQSGRNVMSLHPITLKWTLMFGEGGTQASFRLQMPPSACSHRLIGHFS